MLRLIIAALMTVSVHAATPAAASGAPPSAPPALVGPSASPLGAPPAGVFFDDALDDPGSGFATGDFADQRVAYVNGRLVLVLRAADRFTLSMRDLGTVASVLRVEATARHPALAGGGYVGLACGAADGAYDAGLVSADGSAVLLRVVAGEALILGRSRSLRGGLPRGPLRLAMECAGSSTRRPGVMLALNDTPLVAASDSGGPSAFTRAGLYVETGAGSDHLRWKVDEIRAVAGSDPMGIPAADPVSDPASVTDQPTAALLRHVPADLRSGCRPTLDASPGTTAEVVCTSTGVDTAIFRAYATSALLDGAFAVARADHGAEATGIDCAAGPAQGFWTSNGQGRGDVLCYRDDGAAVIEWTDRTLRIGVIATRTDGSFGALAAWWVNAGPLP